MKENEKAIEGYVAKLAKMTNALISIGLGHEDEIVPKFENNPERAAYWLEGAKIGALTMFLYILTDEEKQAIGHEVMDTATEGKESIGLRDYIDAALVVLERHGVHIPVPEGE